MTTTLATMSDPSTKPARPGRTPLLNPDTQDRIVSAVRAGSYLDDAALLTGISYQTLLHWMRQGRDAQTRLDTGETLTDRDHLYLDFLKAVETARAEAQLRNVAIIQKAANEGTWQAAAWYLERTNPKKWGRHETVEIGVSDDRPTTVTEIATLLDQRIALMRERSLGVIDAEVIDDESDPPNLQIAK